MRLLLASLFLLPLLGCAGAAPALPECAVMAVSDAAQDNQRGTVTGTVKAPLKLLGQPAGDDQPLGEAPVASAEVSLADANGTPLPGVAKGLTDAAGSYRLSGVPSGHTFVVQARFTGASGRPATARALVRSTASGTRADLDGASSLVVSGAASAFDGFDGALDTAGYQVLVAGCRARLTNGHGPALDDDGALGALLAEIRRADAALNQRFEAFTRQLATRAE